MLEQIKQGEFKMKSLNQEADSSVIIMNDQYAVFANKKQKANDYLNNERAQSAAPMLVKQHVSQQPFAMFFDYNSWAKRTGGAMANNAADTLIYDASLKTFQNFVFNGGTLEGNTYKYRMSINFVNKKESSLIQLLEFGKVLQQAQDLRDKENEEFEKMLQQNADGLEF
jgi:hypothetical protein